MLGRLEASFGKGVKFENGASLMLGRVGESSGVFWVVASMKVGWGLFADVVEAATLRRHLSVVIQSSCIFAKAPPPRPIGTSMSDISFDD